MPGLSNEVRAYRFERMRHCMREHGCDALAFTSPDWFEWASNHAMSAPAWVRPYLLVVTATGNSFALADATVVGSSLPGRLTLTGNTRSVQML